MAKLLIEQGVKTSGDLTKCKDTFESSTNYQKAIRFGSQELKDTLEGYNSSILVRNTENTYNEAISIMNSAVLQNDFIKAKGLFDSLGEYKDSLDKAKECVEKADLAKKEQIYKDATSLLEKSAISYQMEIKNIKTAISSFEKIADYKDSSEKISVANNKIAELARKDTTNKEKRKKLVIRLTVFVAIVVAMFILVKIVVIPTMKYNDALDLIANKQYDEGYLILSELDDFKDSKDQILKSYYGRAEESSKNNELEEAYNLYDLAEDYSDAKDKAKECRYKHAVKLRKERKWDEANSIFVSIKEYKDSKELIHYHDWELVESKNATCEEKGSRSYICKVCGDKKTDTLNAFGHTWAAATCTSPKTCTRCGKIEGTALGHNNVGTKCTRCGEITFEPLVVSDTSDGVVMTGINLPSGRFEMVISYTNAPRDSSWSSASLYDKDGNYIKGTSSVNNDETIKVVFQGPVVDGYLEFNGVYGGYCTVTIRAF